MQTTFKAMAAAMLAALITAMLTAAKPVPPTPEPTPVPTPAGPDLRRWDGWTKLPLLKPSSGDQSIYTICFGSDRIYTFHRGWVSAAIAVVAGGCR
jgi:hypothetical protein